MSTPPARRDPRADGEVLGLPEAAERLGVHYMTVYRYVRTGVLRATRRNGRWEVPSAAIDELTQRASAEHGAGRSRRAPYRARLVDRMLASDTAGAWQVVERALASGMTPRRVHLDLLAPALRDIGDRWERDEIDVGQEHAATAVASRLVGRLGPMLTRRGPSRGSVLVAGAPGERHALPMVMLADLLRADGWDVVELGPDTPIDDLVATAARIDRLVAVAISVGSDATRSSAARAAAAVRAVTGAPVVIGGPGIGDEAAALDLGADAWGRDADEVAEVVQRLMG